MVERGSLAQLVEQRPEEPCVPSSSLGGATKIISSSKDGVIILANPSGIGASIYCFFADLPL